jgi:hypothetical protein
MPRSSLSARNGKKAAKKGLKKSNFSLKLAKKTPRAPQKPKKPVTLSIPLKTRSFHKRTSNNTTLTFVGFLQKTRGYATKIVSSIRNSRPQVTKAQISIQEHHRRYTVAAVVVLGALGMIFAVRSILAVAETRVVSSQADWEAGEFWNNTLDTATTPGSLTIKSGGVGTWDASTPGFPENLRGNYGLASEPADIGTDLTTDGSYVYMIVGGRQPDFFRYNPDTNTWKQLADAPTPFLYSSAITYYDGAIYAINGNDGLSTTDATGAFFKYDIYTDTWSTLSNAPDVWGSTSAQGGADIESGNNGKLYAVQGGGQSGFFIYDTQTNAWSSGTSVPDPVNATTSHPLIFSDTAFTIGSDTYCTTGCIYSVLGSNRFFFRYDLALEQWFTNFQNFPSYTGTGNIAAGSAMAFDNTNDDIYVFNGGNTEFVKYDVNTISGSGGTWDANAAATENTQRATAAGASMIYLNGYVYATLGGVPEFVRYDVGTPKWDAIITQAATSTTGDNLIAYVPNGADCSDASGCLFVAQANAAAPIRRYLIGARTWAASVSSTPAALSTGSAMCYDGSGNLFIVRGGGSTNTQVYNFPINAALDQAFSTLTAPAAAGAGADIACTADNRFYLLHGNGGVLFSYYDGQALPSPTFAAENAINANGEPYLNVSYGAALASNRTDVADATDVYALIGNGRGVLLKFNIAGDTWDELTNMPTAPGTNVAGAQYTNTMVYDRTDNLYVFPGKMSKEVWRYDMSGNSWSRAADAPVRLGRSHGVTHGNAAGTMYLMRGENFNGIHKFNFETDAYIPAATWVSAPMDLHYVSSFTSLTSNATLNGNTIDFSTRSSDDGASWSAWASVSGTTIASAANRYIQVKAQLNSAAGDDAPVLDDFTITYEKDSTAPANPTVSAWTSSAKTTTLATPATTFATNPYFEFTPPAQTESPISGYYVAWTSGASCSTFNPSTSEDYFQTGTTYTVNSSVVNGTQYCLRVATKDVAGNVSSAANLLLYTYTGISPAATRQWSSQADFAYTGTTATDVNTNASSGTALQLSAVSNGAWSSEAPLPAAVSNGAAIVGDGNGSLYILRGAGQQTFYHYNINTKVITAKTNYGAAVNTGASAVFVSSGATGCADASGCVFATRGATTTEWRRYDITANTWTAASPGAGSLTVLPLTAANGASLAYNGSDTIYFLGGSTAPSTRFYSYNLGTGVWTQRSDVDQTVGLGGALSYVPTNIGACTAAGGCVYATRGNNTSHFWKGTIASSGAVTWSYTTNIPVWTGDGAAIRRVGSYLYLIRGTASNGFYRFDLSTSTWTSMPTLPTIKGQGSEQGLAYDTATNTLYSLRGYNVEATVLAFDITRNLWKGTAIPHGFSTAGFSTGTMAYDTQTGYVYAGRGVTFSDWWQLNPTTNAWLRKADVPHTLSTGADAEYVNHGTDSYDGVYVLTGNEAQGDNVGFFYRYNPTTDVWTRLANTPGEPTAGADLVWDGTNTIYTAQGGTTAYYKYVISTNTWSTVASTIPVLNGSGSCAVRINVSGTDYIYLTRANSQANIYRFNIGTETWDAAATVESAPAVLVGADACVADGQGNILVPQGTTNTNMYVLDPDGDSNGVWTTRAVPQTYTNGQLVMTTNNVILGNRGTSTSAIDRYIVATASTGYEDFGQWTSEILDFGAGLYGFGGIAVNAAEATNTTMTVETRTCSDAGCAASATDSHWGSWTAVTNTHPVGTVKTSTVASTLARYGQARITFRSDQVATPTIYDVTWSSYTDGTDPTNPVSAGAYTDNGKTVSINPGDWTNDATPYFEWTGSDNAGGIGLEGFYVYFGTDNSCTDPSGAACNASNLAHVSGSHYYAVAGDGVTGSWNAASQSSTALTSGTYYLKIMSRDRNANVTDAAVTGFTFQVDVANPSAPGSIVATPAGYSSLNSFGFTWTAGSDTGGSGINQYCYTTEGPGATETCVSAATLSIANIQAYQARANVFKVRSRDLAGNYSSAYAPVNYYFSGNTPAAPQGLVVTPTSQTDNNTFSFSWGLPSSCLGQTPCDAADILRYCYTLNELPSADTCGYNTAGSATPSPDGGWTTTTQTADRSLAAFSAATKQGTNTFYLIAADAIGNIDYTAVASVDFTFTSTAPGAPGSVQAIDSSDRSTKRYSVTLTWDEPTDKGSGVEQYAIYRCTKESATATNCDGPSTTDEPPTNYSRIATNKTLGYLDLGLDSTKVYAYFLRAVGTGGALSGNSSIVAEQPEGRFTSPPPIVEGPIVAPDSFAAVVTWRTERTASSFVEFGTTVDALSKEQGTATQIDAHEVRVTGLQPKTTYFFRVKSIDIDENIAYSSIGQFTTLEAPRVENVKITDIRLNDAIISWTSTKEATAIIQYGPTTDYGFTYTAASGFSSTHTVKLENLKDSTTYHFRLEGVDRADNPIASDDYNFTTLTFPKILTVSAENKAEGQTEVKWTTNVQTTSEVEYYNENAAPKTQGNSSLVREHSILVFGLEDATEYKFKVRGRDQFGYEAVSGENKFRTLEDTTPPVISEVKSESNTVGSGDAAKIQIIVSWKTNEPTSSQVQYGEGLSGSSYSAETDENAERVRDHLVVIGGLTPAKTYHFRVVSKDKAGNESKSQGYSILTSRARQSFLQIVIGNLEDTFSWLGGVGNLFGG